ncbi:hypothetical protein F5883DRAFT_384664, partial [Diaporthe sp. PMI_573]
ERDMAEAITDVRSNGVSLRKAAAKHGIPTMALSSRMSGPAHRLSEADENRLVVWIKRMEAFGHAPS